MTLDEAIIHAEEVADELDNECEYYEIGGIGGTGEQRKCAEEHRQLAEWLKELKRYRMADDNITAEDLLK